MAEQLLTDMLKGDVPYEGMVVEGQSREAFERLVKSPPIAVPSFELTFTTGGLYIPRDTEPGQLEDLLPPGVSTEVEGYWRFQDRVDLTPPEGMWEGIGVYPVEHDKRQQFEQIPGGKPFSVRVDAYLQSGARIGRHIPSDEFMGYVFETLEGQGYLLSHGTLNLATPEFVASGGIDGSDSPQAILTYNRQREVLSLGVLREETVSDDIKSWFSLSTDAQ